MYRNEDERKAYQNELYSTRLNHKTLTETNYSDKKPAPLRIIRKSPAVGRTREKSF